MSKEEITRRFTHVAPTDVTRPQHEAINTLFLEVAIHLDEILPEGREKALVITKLQECRAWSNAAIATSTPKETP